MFELTPKEVRVPVAFREGGHRFKVTHIFQPPSQKDWLEYETLLNARVVEEGKESRLSRQHLDAGESLWNACARGVEGYGSVELAAIPLQHRMAAIAGLGQVGIFRPEVDEDAPYEFNPTSVFVELEAARDGVIHHGLRHEFRRPTPQELKDFSKITSSAVFLRGARNPTTLLPSLLKPLIGFYDKLIQTAEGYAIGGISPITQPDCVKYMDAMHKKVAIQGLFAPEDTE